MLEWVDSCGPHGWKLRKELKGYTPDTVISVGFVLEETPEYVTLAPHWARDCVDGVISIPACAIKRRLAIRMPTGFKLSDGES